VPWPQCNRCGVSREVRGRTYKKGWSYGSCTFSIGCLSRGDKTVTTISESIDLSGFVVGNTYDKEEIARFGQVTAPATPRAGGWGTGILPFKNVVLLLVTLDNEEDASYEDYFERDELHWQSQNRHSQKSPFIKSLAGGKADVRLFARVLRKIKGRTQPFVYCGRLAWSHIEGGNYPVSCRFKLLDLPVNPSEEFQSLLDWEPQLPLDELGQAIVLGRIEAAKSLAAVDSLKDARELIQRAVAVRRGQKTFRKKLLKAYGGRCAVTGTTVAAILEAAHIVPYKGAHTHRTDNGLLLRSDIHTLFDLGLLWVSQERTVQLAEELGTGEYGSFHGSVILQAAGAQDQPLLEHLAYHERTSSEMRSANAQKKLVTKV
jgi:hypothetical protein